jgi:hypothetical protein
MQIYNNNVCVKQNPNRMEDLIVLLKSISMLQSTYIIKLNEGKPDDDIITKVITELSIYILNLTNNMDETEDYYTEFWVKQNIHSNIDLHYDCDEYDRMINKNVNYRKPLQTGILYLTDSDSNIPTTVIDDLDDTNKKLVYSFPRKKNLFVFNGGKYLHGNSFFKEAIPANDRFVLVLNIWKTKPPLFSIVFNNTTIKALLFQNNNIDILNQFENLNKSIQNEKEALLAITLKNDNIVNIKLPEDICITPELLNHYANNNKCPLSELNNKLYKSMVDVMSTRNISVFLIENQETQLECIGKSKKADMKINIDERRFLQRGLVPGMFTPDICEWFIGEIEQYTKSKGWITDRHSSYPTTDIEVKSIPCLFQFMLMSVMAEIGKHINATYSISNTTFNIVDMFIVKYDVDSQRTLAVHEDNCCITASILLSDKSVFSGCYVEYEDGIRYDNITQGDMLIHTHNDSHYVTPITSGVRYVLVLFLDIYTK